MPSELLKCTLCPKKPKFSDVSHLLTHVGSKGHLAHLHGIQVRSHQELTAAHQLAVYNQWFQEHGVAALLSERMQQKEQKKAQKISMIAKTARSNASVTVKVETPNYIELSSITRHDPFLTPVRASRVTTYPTLPTLPSSPPRLVSHDEQLELALSAGIASDNVPSPGTPQLKGVQYPGMNLFDAATEELKRKRNQKKDGSVLRKLENNSAMVEAIETVHSATGIVLKKRHMDDLENDSPVEGEEKISHATPKRRRVFGPRRARVAKVKQEKVVKRKPGRPRKQLKTPQRADSPTFERPVVSTPYSMSTEDDALDFKYVTDAPASRPRRSKFVVYQESSPSFGVDGASEDQSSAYVDTASYQSQLAFPVPSWHQHEAETYDPFKLIRDRFSSYPSLTDTGYGKENTGHLGSSLTLRANTNPLMLHNGDENNAPAGICFAPNRLNANIASDMDPFRDNEDYVPVRNPLAATLHLLKAPKQEIFEYSVDEIAPFATQYQQPLFAP